LFNVLVNYNYELQKISQCNS